MQSDVELVKAQNNIVDVISDYVKLIKAGSTLKANCPFHQEKTPSFVVNEEKQIYHCFGCGQGGDMLTFLMEIEGIDFREALKMLAERAGIELTNNFKSNPESQEKKNNGQAILDLAVRFYEKQLWSESGQKKVLSYLKNRGLSEDIIQKFQIGFAPDGWNFLEQFLIKQNFKQIDIFEVGLLVEKKTGGYYDRFRGRIIFPISDVLGRIVGFTARVLPGDDESQAKYVNTPESNFYHKSKILYGIHLAKQSIKQKDQVIILEGQMDVIASWQAGIENVVAVSGTALTDDHIQILKRYTKNFVLFFDSDEAGLKAARRSAKICLSADINLAMVILVDGKDAADLVKDNPKKLLEVVQQAKNIIETFIELAREKYDFSQPTEKRLAVDEILDLVVSINNEIEREAWVLKCADIFNLKEETVFSLIAKLQKENSQFNYSQKKSVNKIESSENSEVKKTRLYQLYKMIALMMLAYPHIWQHIYDNRSKFTILMEHNFLADLIREGPDCNFEVGAFIDQDENRERIYKEAMQLKQQYELEHQDGSSPIADVEEYVDSIIKEKNKEKLIQLTQQLKQAQVNENSQKQQEILEQINNISQKIKN
jgi:DNA primase